MMKLTDREWKPFAINTLFERFTPGKCSAVTHLEKSEYGIEYIGATNHNNGVLCYLAENEENLKLVQDGNCIGFIKDGDGSAGYAIYKRESFVSTVNVIYGYASWLNSLTGLFFVGAQDMIKHKYSHGYKRNMQHLKADHVMLPADDNGQPDYQFMADYELKLLDQKQSKIRSHVKQELANLGSYVYIDDLNAREWSAFALPDMFETERGREKNMKSLIPGSTPLVSAKKINNGVKSFVGNPHKIISAGTITLNNDGDGGAGLAYYQPINFALDTHVTALHSRKRVSPYALQFIAGSLSKQHAVFGHGRSISSPRAQRLKIMLPVNDQGQPDYDYMEQYIKNKMIQKYKKYLEYLGK